MKVLIILSRWKGGVGAVIKNVSKQLQEKGHTVDVISREDDLKIYSLLDSLVRLRHIVNKKNNYDILYTQDWSSALPFLFPYPVLRSNHCCCFHGNQSGKIGKILQTIVGKLMGNKLFVVGDSLKKRFPKSNMVYNGVDIEQFKPLNEKREYLGWINKETEVLSKKDILKLAKNMKLKPLIVENYGIPFEEMNEKIYNKCEAFISLPPISAGFNLCWVEAMAAGVPIIIGNNEGIGCKLNIDKFKSKKDFFKKIEKLSKKDYRKYILKSGLSWENHVNKLLEAWTK